MDIKPIFSSALFTSAIFFFITGVFFRESILFSINGGATTVTLGETSNVGSVNERNVYSKIRHSIYIAQSSNSEDQSNYTKSVHKKSNKSKQGNLKIDKSDGFKDPESEGTKKNDPPVKKPTLLVTENGETKVVKQEEEGEDARENKKEKESTQETSTLPPSTTTIKQLKNGKIMTHTSA